MYKTILVPLDGSERAEKIFDHVEGLARCYNSKVVLLHVARPPRIDTYDENGHYELLSEKTIEEMRQAESYLSYIRGEFEKKGIRASAHCICGPVVKEIIEAAEKEKADLIAIASHGRTGLSRVFYGSVAAGLLQRVDRPLIVIRSRR